MCVYSCCYSIRHRDALCSRCIWFLVMRIGKPLEHLQAALKALNSNSRTSEQVATVLRQLGYASYLIYDALVWVSALFLTCTRGYILSLSGQANSVKFISLSKENAQKYTRRAFRFWFFGIFFSICHGMLKVRRYPRQTLDRATDAYVGWKARE